MTQEELELLRRCGLVRMTGRATPDGKVVEFELTHAGRVLLGAQQPQDFEAAESQLGA